MPFTKKTAKIDIHLWLEEKHLAILDALARQYQMSRAAVIAQLLEDYERNQRDQHEPLP